MGRVGSAAVVILAHRVHDARARWPPIGISIGARGDERVGSSVERGGVRDVAILRKQKEPKAKKRIATTAPVLPGPK